MQNAKCNVDAMHDAARISDPKHFSPFSEYFSLFGRQKSIHRLLITSLFIHPRSSIRRLLYWEDLSGILLYSPPSAPQLPRFSHTSSLSPTSSTSTPSCPIHLLLDARFFHVWAEIRRFEFSKDELNSVELFGVAIWDGYFDFDLKGVDVADPAAQGARKEGADAGRS